MSCLLRTSGNRLETRTQSRPARRHLSARRREHGRDERHGGMDGLRVDRDVENGHAAVGERAIERGGELAQGFDAFAVGAEAPGRRRRSARPGRSAATERPNPISLWRFTMPHAASLPITTTTSMPWRTAVSTSIAESPNAPSPTRATLGSSGRASFAAIANGMPPPSVAIGVANEVSSPARPAGREPAERPQRELARVDRERGTAGQRRRERLDQPQRVRRPRRVAVAGGERRRRARRGVELLEPRGRSRAGPSWFARCSSTGGLVADEGRVGLAVAANPDLVRVDPDELGLGEQVPEPQDDVERGADDEDDVGAGERQLAQRAQEVRLAERRAGARPRAGPRAARSVKTGMRQVVASWRRRPDASDQNAPSPATISGRSARREAGARRSARDARITRRTGRHEALDLERSTSAVSSAARPAAPPAGRPARRPRPEEGLGHRVGDGLGRRTVCDQTVNGAAAAAWSTSCGYPLPRSDCRIAPVMTTSGTPAMPASAIGVNAFVNPGPPVTIRTPGSPVASDQPSAMKPAPASCRASIRRTPSSSHPPGPRRCGRRTG